MSMCPKFKPKTAMYVSMKKNKSWVMKTKLNKLKS